jgi:hypothetical protein
MRLARLIPSRVAHHSTTPTAAVEIPAIQIRKIQANGVGYKTLVLIFKHSVRVATRL